MHGKGTKVPGLCPILEGKFTQSLAEAAIHSLTVISKLALPCAEI